MNDTITTTNDSIYDTINTDDIDDDAYCRPTIYPLC